MCYAVNMLLLQNIVSALHLLSQTGECGGIAYYENIKDATGSVMLQHASFGFKELAWCAIPTVAGFNGQAVLDCYLAIESREDYAASCNGVDLYEIWEAYRAENAKAETSPKIVGC